jgi:hypothetical protein
MVFGFGPKGTQFNSQGRPPLVHPPFPQAPTGRKSFNPKRTVRRIPIRAI